MKYLALGRCVFWFIHGFLQIEFVRRQWKTRKYADLVILTSQLARMVMDFEGLEIVESDWYTIKPIPFVDVLFKL